MEKNIKNIVMRKQKRGFGKRWKTGRMGDLSKTAAGMPDQDFKFQTLSSGDGEKKKNTANDKLTFRLSFYWHIY